MRGTGGVVCCMAKIEPVYMEIPARYEWKGGTLGFGCNFMQRGSAECQIEASEKRMMRREYSICMKHLSLRVTKVGCRMIQMGFRVLR